MNSPQLFEDIEESCSTTCKIINDPNALTADISLNRLPSKTSNNLFNVISMNIRSVNKNLDNFLIYVTRLRLQIHVIILSECWCDENSVPPTIDGFTVYFTKRSFNQNDGVIMYIRNEINATVKEIELSESNCLEAKISNMIILGIYRPYCFKNPTPFLDSLDTYLTTTKTRNVVLTGDININTLETDNAYVGDYLELIGSHGLQSAIDIPTHGRTCLDHFMCKLVGSFQSYVLITDITDHYPLLLSISSSLGSNLSIPRSITRTKINFTSLNNEIKSKDWNSFLKINDPNIAAENLIKTLQDLIALHSDTVTFTKKNRPLKPWITTGIVRCFQKRDRMQLAVKKNPDNCVLKNVFLTYRNICNQIAKEQKINYYKYKLSLNYKNNKGTWNTVKEMCNIKSNHTQAIALLNLLPTGDKSLDLVNTYFTSIGKELAADVLAKSGADEAQLLKNTTSSTRSTESLFLYPTDPIEIDKIILKLKTNSAPGIDNIPVNIIKNSHAILCSMIAHICNLSISTGIFPNIFKKAVVVPIYKGGEVEAVSNYRPISLLSTISKIVEKVVNIRLTNFLESKQHLAINQHGFRAGRNTEDAVASLSEIVTKSLDSGKRCLTVFLDLKKAFDTVSTPLLLRRLEDLGVRGSALKWFDDYLSDRSQIIRVANATSSSQTINYGVPQGSTLGPTLFLVYVNDLCSLRLNNGSILAFADDTALIFWGDSWESVKKSAEEGLDKVMRWLDDSLLTLNVPKTKFICFKISDVKKPPSDFTVRAHTSLCTTTGGPVCPCDCPTLIQTSTHKYLGVIIDDKLNWGAHISLLSKRLRKLLHIFRNLRASADTNLITKIYLALGQSLITYCIPIWGGAATTYLLVLERAQRAVIKVMLQKPRIYPTVQLYKEANLLSVRQLFIYNSIIRHHKTIDPTTLPVHKRRPRTLVPNLHSRFARRQSIYTGPFLYRHFNDLEPIYKMNRNALKITLKENLKSLDYQATESILPTNTNHLFLRHSLRRV